MWKNGIISLVCEQNHRKAGLVIKQMLVGTCDLERYRSGHNEAVLKTVCPKGRVGSNPTLSAWMIRL